jgi:hypothetical protein
MIVKKSRLAVSMGAAVLMAGCASTQLNYNTLELASSVGNIQTGQVLANLSLFMDNPSALPAHVDLSAGTASTTYSVNPTITTPLNFASSALSQFTKTVSGSPSSASEAQSVRTIGSSGLSTTATDAWAQSWSYEPIIDGDELRRLRVLYAYALGYMRDVDFIEEYPVVRKLQTLSYQNVKADKSYQLYCPDLGFKSSTVMPETQTTVTDLANQKATTQITKASPSAAECDKITIQTQVPDEQFLHEPSCIICIRDKYGVFTYTTGVLKTALTINPRLRRLHGHWLLNEHDPSHSDATPLGRFGGHSLFIRGEDQWKLSEFTLFVLTATAQSTVGTAAAGAGSPSAAGATGKKPAALQPGAPAPALTLPLGTTQVVPQ